MTNEEILALAENLGHRIIGVKTTSKHLLVIPPVILIHEKTGKHADVALVGKDETHLAGKVYYNHSGWRGEWTNSSEFREPTNP